MSDVEVANPDWAKSDHMLKVDQVDFEIPLLPLLGGNFVLPRLTLRTPEISVETNDKDQSNWSFEQSPVVNVAAKAAAPKQHDQTPLIGRFEIVGTQGRPEEFRPARFARPVVVARKIRSPQISLGRVIPIPTPVIGDAKDINCPALTQQLLAAS